MRIFEKARVRFRWNYYYNILTNPQDVRTLRPKRTKQEQDYDTTNFASLKI